MVGEVKSQKMLCATVRPVAVLQPYRSHHFPSSVCRLCTDLFSSTPPPLPVTKINSIILIGAEPTEGLAVRG